MAAAALGGLKRSLSTPNLTVRSQTDLLVYGHDAPNHEGHHEHLNNTNVTLQAVEDSVQRRQRLTHDE